MLRYFFALVLLMHGLIHFIGFAKAFNYGNITQLTKAISKPMGVAWFLTAILFIIATLILLLKKDAWPYIAFGAVLLSQFLILYSWQDAKFGTIANGLILLAVVLVLFKIDLF